MEVKETVKDLHIKKLQSTKRDWKEQVPHSQFIRHIVESAGEEWWKWLNNSGIKREKKAHPTNLIKGKIKNTQADESI